MPTTIIHMPAIIPVSIGISARWKLMSRPIQNMGTCSRTPAVTATQPAAKN